MQMGGQIHAITQELRETELPPVFKASALTLSICHRYVHRPLWPFLPGQFVTGIFEYLLQAIVSKNEVVGVTGRGMVVARGQHCFEIVSM